MCSKYGNVIQFSVAFYQTQTNVKICEQSLAGVETANFYFADWYMLGAMLDEGKCDRKGC